MDPLIRERDYLWAWLVIASLTWALLTVFDILAALLASSLRESGLLPVETQTMELLGRIVRWPVGAGIAYAVFRIFASFLLVGKAEDRFNEWSRQILEQQERDARELPSRQGAETA
jgi:hypothetical protein